MGILSDRRTGSAFYYPTSPGFAGQDIKRLERATVLRGTVAREGRENLRGSVSVALVRHMIFRASSGAGPKGLLLFHLKK
jgi:hypothetical protein